LPDFDGGSGCACARTMANTGIMGHMGCLRWSYLRFSWRLLCHALWRWWFVGVFPHERLKLIPVIYSVHPLPDSRLIGQIRIFDDLPYTSPMPDSVPRSSSPEHRTPAKHSALPAPPLAPPRHHSTRRSVEEKCVGARLVPSGVWLELKVA
jgi:hypothetical protein